MATDPQLPSRIDSVAIYRTGALVTRLVELPADAPTRIRIGPLPLSIDDGSVRVALRPAEGSDEAPRLVAADVRVALEVPEPDEALLPARPEDVDAAEQRVGKLRDQLEQIGDEAERIERIGVVARPSARSGREPPPSPAETRLALLDLRERRLARLDDQRERTTRELRDAERRLADLLDRERRATSARRTQPHELRKSVTVSLRGERGGPCRLALTYQVRAARWAPSYVLRLDRDLAAGTLELRALVSQRSGEDWEGVELTLSTAELHGWAELPELASIRIGRRQPSLPKRGWREPPTGAAELFADFDRERTLEAPPEPSPASEAYAASVVLASSLDEGAYEREEMRLEEAAADLPSPSAAPQMAPRGAMPTGAPMPPGAPMPAAGAAPMAPPMQAMEPMAKRSAGLFGAAAAAIGGAVMAGVDAFAGDAGGADGLRGHAGRAEAAGASADLLDYGRLRMPAATAPDRGALVLRTRRELYVTLVEDSQIVVNLGEALALAERQSARCLGEALPTGYRPIQPSGFDYVYRASARLHAASDGVFHSLSISRHAVDARARFVVVPRESRDAFRFLELDNPIEAPLLDGPVDVYVGDHFLLGSAVHEVPPEGLLRLGLGVEQRIKVARNARYEEKSGGLMGGKLDLMHTIEVELSNQLARSAEVEVRERIPVLREGEDDITVREGDVSPPWESWEPEDDDTLEGGRRWRVTLEPGARRTLRAAYDVRIASKNELVGGNRREQ